MSQKKTKYLITGATGFIGPHLIRILASAGDKCTCLIRPGSNIEPLKNLDVKFIECDITKKESLRGVAEGVDCLIHMATLGHMDNFSVTEDMFNSVNVYGTVNIMQEALKSKVKRIVHCSSVAAMGICDDLPATEKSRCRPHHPYGRSKLKAENEVLKLVSDFNLPAVIIRFSMVYGPGDKRDMLKLARLAKKGLFPKVGSRQKLTPLIYVDDAVKGLLLAAKKGKKGEIYLLTNKKSEPFDRIRKIILNTLKIFRVPVFVPEWAALFTASCMEKAFTLTGKSPPVSRKNIESTLADRVFSIEKAKKELGFNPQIDPEKGLRETVLWYKNKGWL